MVYSTLFLLTVSIHHYALATLFAGSSCQATSGNSRVLPAPRKRSSTYSIICLIFTNYKQYIKCELVLPFKKKISNLAVFRFICCLQIQNLIGSSNSMLTFGSSSRLMNNVMQLKSCQTVFFKMTMRSLYLNGLQKTNPM